MPKHVFTEDKPTTIKIHMQINNEGTDERDSLSIKPDELSYKPCATYLVIGVEHSAYRYKRVVIRYIAVRRVALKLEQIVYTKSVSIVYKLHFSKKFLIPLKSL